MDKKIIGMIVLLILVLSVIIFINEETSPESQSPFSKDSDENGTEKSGEDCLGEGCPSSENDSSSVENQSSGTGSGEGSGTGGGSDGTVEDPGKELPEDINQSPCGVYYEEYGACKGTCPEGECVSGGPTNESCYCQEIE